MFALMPTPRCDNAEGCRRVLSLIPGIAVGALVIGSLSERISGEGAVAAGGAIGMTVCCLCYATQKLISYGCRSTANQTDRVARGALIADHPTVSSYGSVSIYSQDSV